MLLAKIRIERFLLFEMSDIFCQLVTYMFCRLDGFDWFLFIRFFDIFFNLILISKFDKLMMY